MQKAFTKNLSLIQRAKKKVGDKIITDVKEEKIKENEVSQFESGKVNLSLAFRKILINQMS